MALRVSKDLPLAELTLRKYERPIGIRGRDLIKKACLSMGLLNPGDSRDSMVDVFSVLVHAEEDLSSKNVEERVIMQRKSLGLPLVGITPPNIRRHIRRLRDMCLIEKRASLYKLSSAQTLSEVFVEKIEQYHLRSITDRIKEYLSAIHDARTVRPSR